MISACKLSGQGGSVKGNDERLSLREAADALGISEVTARRWVRSGKLKAYQPGRKYQIPASAVEELLEEEAEAPKAKAPPSPLSAEGTDGWRFRTSTPQLRKNLQLVESWVQPWMETIQRGDLDPLYADTIRIAAYSLRSGLERYADIVTPMDEIIEAFNNGERVPEDLLRAALNLERAIRGPGGIEDITELAAKAGRPPKDAKEVAERKRRSDTVADLPAWLRARKAG
jgi:excisionase family DNA binding protein